MLQNWATQIYEYIENYWFLNWPFEKKIVIKYYEKGDREWFKWSCVVIEKLPCFMSAVMTRDGHKPFHKPKFITKITGSWFVSQSLCGLTCNKPPMTLYMFFGVMLFMGHSCQQTCWCCKPGEWALRSMEVEDPRVWSAKGGLLAQEGDGYLKN